MMAIFRRVALVSLIVLFFSSCKPTASSDTSSANNVTKGERSSFLLGVKVNDSANKTTSQSKLIITSIATSKEAQPYPLEKMPLRKLVDQSTTNVMGGVDNLLNEVRANSNKLEVGDEIVEVIAYPSTQQNTLDTSRTLYEFGISTLNEWGSTVTAMIATPAIHSLVFAVLKNGEIYHTNPVTLPSISSNNYPKISDHGGRCLIYNKVNNKQHLQSCANVDYESACSLSNSAVESGKQIKFELGLTCSIPK